jgi:N-acetylmuramoyl-L-alanine amidase
MYGFRSLVRAAILGGLLSWAVPAMGEPVALAVRVGPHPDKTRFVLELSEPVAFGISVLDDPYRVVIDLPEIAWQLPADAGTKGAGLVTGFRYGTVQAGTARVVIDLKAPAKVKGAFLAAPEADRQHRLVLDLELAAPEAFQAELQSRKPTALTAARPPAPAPPAKKKDERKVIAIDAGHGGVDPGAIGISGAYEKDVTLAMARELKKHLERDGRYRVVMTRDDDTFIRLRDRVGIARQAGADLFISIHADSIGRSSISGASIYTLSEQASDKEAEALAAKENKADIIGGVDLSDKSMDVSTILIDLAQRESMNEAARLAGNLTEHLRATGSILDRSHRFAGFAVLKAPDIPSVLIELGYLSNKTEEAKLRSEAHRARMGAAIRKAVDGYFGHQAAQRAP